MSKPPDLLDTLPGPAISADRTPVEPLVAVRADSSDGLAATVDAASSDDKRAAAESGEQLPYQTWKHYRIVSFLGAGGMGAVYKARDPRLHRHVAVKFLRGGQAEAFDTRQRRHFEREARAQASLEHPHICKIYEVGEVEGQPYIAMQFIQGSSLAGLSQAMTREDKVRTIRDVAEALHAAHQKNLVHRDIKPGKLVFVENRTFIFPKPSKVLGKKCATSHPAASSHQEHDDADVGWIAQAGECCGKMRRFLPEFESERLLHPAVVLLKLSTASLPTIVLKPSAREPTYRTLIRARKRFDVSSACGRSIFG